MRPGLVYGLAGIEARRAKRLAQRRAASKPELSTIAARRRDSARTCAGHNWKDMAAGGFTRCLSCDYTREDLGLKPLKSGPRTLW